jgi:hypothetical protein
MPLKLLASAFGVATTFAKHVLRFSAVEVAGGDNDTVVDADESHADDVVSVAAFLLVEGLSFLVEPKSDRILVYSRRSGI